MASKPLTALQRGSKLCGGEARFRLCVILLGFDDWFTAEEVLRSTVGIAGGTLFRNLAWLVQLEFCQVDRPRSGQHHWRRSHSVFWALIQEIASSEDHQIPQIPADLESPPEES